jgi:hypothetical protein
MNWHQAKVLGVCFRHPDRPAKTSARCEECAAQDELPGLPGPVESTATVMTFIPEHGKTQ